jgi:hypothetical protein
MLDVNDGELTEQLQEMKEKDEPPKIISLPTIRGSTR